MENQKKAGSIDKAVDMLFENRKNYIIIGLTGRTGSGCSTVADLLNKNSFKGFQYLPKPQNTAENTNERRKEKIVYNYMTQNWEKFYVIRMHNIITSFILESEWSEFSSLAGIKGDINAHNDFKKEYEKWKQQVAECKNTIEKEEKEYAKAFQLYINDIEIYTQKIKDFLSVYSEKKYAELYQEIANNIRKSGKITEEDFNPCQVFALSHRTNQIIKIIGKNHEILNEGKKKVLVVIDAFRNPYEATFFKDRYSSFYLFSINVENSERERRLLKEGGLMDSEVKKIDEMEYPLEKTKNLEEIFYRQNIEKCVELSDVYLYNPQDDSELRMDLKKQIVKYLSLIMHPGIITPNHIERCMQIAYNAKVNSGCISRQVGALVTDSEYAIKSIGWNDVPQGQTPCNLRSLPELYVREDSTAYSEYELTNKDFKQHIDKLQLDIEGMMKVPENEDGGIERVKGRPIAYCFKDLYNGMKKEKNQVHTRSLHAEENAFLQVAKYGGMAIKNGYLFTTASPCELCAKKAYQLGIKKIFYIDLYPGISEEHILNNGNNKPKLVLFHGAIGRAYTQFYTPILSYKDELYMLMGKDMTDKISCITDKVLGMKKKIHKIKLNK